MGFKELAKLINQANKQRTPEQEFLYVLNEGIGRLGAEGSLNHPTSRSFKPSSIGGCLRIPFFQITGAKEDETASEDPGLQGIMQSGTDRHERIQTAISELARLGYDCEWVDVGEFVTNQNRVKGTRVISKNGMETKLMNDDLNMRFMCDGVIKFMGKYYIIEIKTETSFKWQGRTSPNPDHIKQATCYSICLGVDQVFFIYENRDVCGKKVFQVDVTQEMKNGLFHVLETVNSHIENGTIPPKSDDCRYCDYKQLCKTC